MVSDSSILDPIRQSNHFGQWLEQLNRDWEAEQRYRHDFWASHDEGAKAEFINDYATHGVREYWIVDPKEETVEQYLHDGSTLKLEVKMKAGALQAIAMPGFEMMVEDIFSDPLGE